MDNFSQDMIDTEAAKFVCEAKKHFEMQRKTANYHKAWLNCEKAYFNDIDDFYNGIAKIRVPALFNKVEDIVPKFERSIFPPDGNWFDATPANPEDETQVMQAFLAVKLLRQQVVDIDAKVKIRGILRSLCIYGTVFVKAYWEHKIKERYVRKNGTREKIWETTFDNPNFYSPSIWDIYADIKDEDLEGIIIERIVKDYEDLYQNREHTEEGNDVGIYRNVEKLKGVKLGLEETVTSDKQISDRFTGLKDHSFGNHENKLEVLECWGQIPKWFLTGSNEDKENHLYVDGLIVVGLKAGEEAVTLRISENPFDNQEIAFVRGRYRKIDGRLYGIGVIEPNVPLQMELNTLRSQAMDNRTFNLRPKWLKDISAGIDDEALKDLNFHVIETLDVNGLVPLRPNDYTATILSSENVIKHDIEEGTVSNTIGGNAGGNSLERTASGLTTVIQSGLDKIEMAISSFEDEVLKPLMNKMWDYNQQFLPDGREIPIIGQQLIRVNPSEITLPPINFSGIRELASKDFKVNTLNVLLQNLAPYAQYGIDPIPVLFLQLRLLGFSELIPEIDKRPNSEEQLEQTPEGEVQLLLIGRKVKIDFNDDHEAYIQAYKQLLAQPNLPVNIAMNTKEALGQRLIALDHKNKQNSASNTGTESDGSVDVTTD
ncbi:MAG: hypothetical protein ACHQ1D_00835 [Nitrososphaerales archaeon]